MYKFRLYVMDRMIKSIQVVEKLTVLLEDALDGNYELEVVDIIENPELAEKDEIVATPTLVKVSAEPVKIIIGDWLDKQSILSSLGLTAKCREVVK